MRKIVLFVLAFVLFSGSFVSCTTAKKYDRRLTALEKSIEGLDQNYKTFSPEELQKEIEFCEKQIGDLEQNDDKLTDTQRQQFSKTKGKYHRLLLEIKIWTATQTISEEGSEFIEYLKGLLD